jgi:hypothetical protein
MRDNPFVALMVVIVGAVLVVGAIAGVMLT